MTVSIYTLSDPRTTQVRYVGKSVDPVRRLRNHLTPSRLTRQTTHLANWLKLLKSLGLRPLLAVVESNLTEESWPIRETYWISKFKEDGCDLTNCLPGGEGGATFGRRGKKWTPQHRENYIKARAGVSILQGDPAGNRAMAIKAFYENKRNTTGDTRPPHSEDTKNKMRLAAKRRDTSVYRKLADAKRGKSLTPEHKRALSEAGKKRWNTTPRTPELSEMARKRATRGWKTRKKTK